jgi:hypothetical protein
MINNLFTPTIRIGRHVPYQKNAGQQKKLLTGTYIVDFQLLFEVINVPVVLIEQ